MTLTSSKRIVQRIDNDAKLQREENEADALHCAACVLDCCSPLVLYGFSDSYPKTITATRSIGTSFSLIQFPELGEPL